MSQIICCNAHIKTINSAYVLALSEFVPINIVHHCIAYSMELYYKRSKAAWTVYGLSGNARKCRRLSMCVQQCLTDSLTVYMETGNGQHGWALYRNSTCMICRYLTPTEDVFLCDIDIKVLYHLQHLVSCLPLVNVHGHTSRLVQGPSAVQVICTVPIHRVTVLLTQQTV